MSSPKAFFDLIIRIKMIEIDSDCVILILNFTFLHYVHYVFVGLNWKYKKCLIFVIEQFDHILKIKLFSELNCKFEI